MPHWCTPIKAFVCKICKKTHYSRCKATKYCYKCKGKAKYHKEMIVECHQCNHLNNGWFIPQSKIRCEKCYKETRAVSINL